MGEQLTVHLTDMAHGGAAVGRHEGKVIFVPFGISGEAVRVEIVRDKGRFAHARLLKVLSASPHRVQPPCPLFGACGGCQWQHVAYEAQLDFKRSIARAQLQRIAGLPDASVHPTLGMATPWRYRNHVQLGVTPSGQLGFMAAHSRRIVPIEDCLLMHPLVKELLDSLDIELSGLLRLSLRAGINTNDQMIIFEMEADQPPDLEVNLPISCVLLPASGAPVTLIGSPYIHEQVAGRTYRISAPSFFQVNTCQTEVLVSQVARYLDPDPASVVLDACCGVGTFALSLAHRAKRVLGVESNAAAIVDARVNARDVGNVTFTHGSIDQILPALDVTHPLVILDPPRSGLSKAAVVGLVGLAPLRIVYVSCDPASLARDIKRLLPAGYELRDVQPIDMFPQTYHTECVAILDRRTHQP